MLIVLEGADGCGKTTLATALAARSPRISVLEFPVRHTHSGGLIQKFLRGQRRLMDNNGCFDTVEDAMVLQSLMLTNRMEQDHLLRLAQHSKHHHLIVCRYWQSGLVYGAKDGLPEDWLLRIHGTLPRADLNVLLDVEPAELHKRRRQRGGAPERYESTAHDRNIVHRYRDLWDRPPAGGSWQVLDATALTVDMAHLVREWLQWA